jgi:hypothetical protein
VKVKFEKYAVRADGEPLYRMRLDDQPVREGLTLDQVILAINRRDEERLGEEHTLQGTGTPGGRR